MNNFLWFGKKLGAIVATAATFCSTTVAALLSQGSSTVATLYGTLHSLLSPSKMPIYGSSGSNGSNTSPDFAQEKSNLREWREDLPVDEHFPDSWELGDEFDHEDYDEWYEDNYEEWWDGPVFNTRGSNWGWEQEAVDEAIAEEDDDLPPIPF